MKKIKIFLIICFCILLSSCYSNRRHTSSLRGLMLLENTQLGRNKAFYSKQNKKTKKITYRKFKKRNKK